MPTDRSHPKFAFIICFCICICIKYMGWYMYQHLIHVGVCIGVYNKKCVHVTHTHTNATTNLNYRVKHSCVFMYYMCAHTKACPISSEGGTKYRLNVRLKNNLISHTRISRSISPPIHQHITVSDFFFLDYTKCPLKDFEASPDMATNKS